MYCILFDWISDIGNDSELPVVNVINFLLCIVFVLYFYFLLLRSLLLLRNFLLLLVLVPSWVFRLGSICPLSFSYCFTSFLQNVLYGLMVGISFCLLLLFLFVLAPNLLLSIFLLLLLLLLVLLLVIVLLLSLLLRVYIVSHFWRV